MRLIVYPHSLEVGGSQLNALELAAAVRDRGHNVCVFAAEPGPLAAMVEQLGLPLVVAPPHGSRPSVRIVRALREVCRRDRIDVVHGYEWPPCLEAFCGPLLFDRVRVGCTVMSMSVAPFIPPSIPLIVGTEQIAAAVRKSRPGAVRVIEPPVDTDANHPRFDGAEFRRVHGLAGRLTIILVSRLAFALKLEGIERAIAAMPYLDPALKAKLVVVGDGPARDQLEQAAARMNAITGDATVTLTGEMADPRPAYAAADIVLGMGGSILRAMAFAKPAVVLGERGFAEVLTPEAAPLFLWQGFYGLGDGNRQPEVLASLLAPLLTAPDLREELGVFSRRFVEERFSLQAAADRQCEYYAEWMTQRVPVSTAFTEAGMGVARLLSHKIRQRADQLRGRRAEEDFNAVMEIEKVAALAGKRP